MAGKFVEGLNLVRIIKMRTEIGIRVFLVRALYHE